MERSWTLVGSHPSLQSIVVVVHSFRLRATPVITLCNHFRPLTDAYFPKLRRVGFIGLDPYEPFDTKIRTLLDGFLDPWHASGIEVKYIGQ
ncbi:hypothetical protein BD410DRAFT_792435 [Rickenella mellea]|uniref:Uncharacterized protein n=1 Tax=Rickenella mellea TaxID=50990 RepID=A0A4Y7PVY1_9AGAM|nr:hypothetical protein BD410DRAFT_792435 [Rickenella mellea]